MAVPLLLVVTGMPSSSKTTVAEGMAGRLGLPLIAKDEIKESLYESLGAEDVSASARLGTGAYALIFGLARTMLASGVSLIVEANFFRDQEPDFASLPDHRLVQIHCEAPLVVVLERYANRSRHAGHHDAEKIKELPARFESGAHSPLRLPGELIQLDTTEPVELDALAERIRSWLETVVWPSVREGRLDGRTVNGGPQPTSAPNSSCGSRASARLRPSRRRRNTG